MLKLFQTVTPFVKQKSNNEILDHPFHSNKTLYILRLKKYEKTNLFIRNQFNNIELFQK